MSGLEDKQQRAVVVLGAVALALAPVAVYARLGTIVLLVLTLIAQPCWDGTVASLRGFARSRLVFVGTLLALWAAVTLFWSPAGRLLALPSVVIVPVMGLLLIAAVRGLSDVAAARVAKLATVGGVLMLALLGMEVWSKGAILRLVVPASPEDLAFDQTASVIEAAARGIAVLAPLTFVYATLIAAETKLKVAGIAFVVLAFAVGASTSMDAGWGAVGAGAIAFVVARVAPRLALAGLFAGLMFYAALAPLIHSRLITLDLTTGFGTRELLGLETRIGIWQYASSLIAEKPWFGHGFDATRELSRVAPLIPGTKYPALPLHTHNGVLQLWLELGLVGIVLMISFLAVALRSLWPLTKHPKYLAVTIATIAAGSVIFLVSFGVWQHWWMALWFLTAGLLVLAGRRAGFTGV